jgi:5-methyltetrahydropteroyltriglutamate--homocysteine methyltransferase
MAPHTADQAGFRADHIGSLLRPPAVLDAHAQLAAGELSPEDVEAIEDDAILAALELQRTVGLGIYSDGEYRRSGWAGAFPASVEGYVAGEPPLSFDWQLPEELAARGQSDRSAIVAAIPQQARVIGAPLRQHRRLAASETAFLAAHAPGPWKITLPAASYNVARGWKPGVTEAVYPTRQDLMDAVVTILAAEVAAVVAEGCRYLQLDNPHLPDYIPAFRREDWRAIGVDPDAALTQDIAGDNAVLAGVDRSQVVVACHVCRGNGRSAWHTSGGYDAIAEEVFGTLDVDRWLLEYDTNRSGGFEPLRFVPPGKTVVLGLVTTKVGVLEPADDIVRRIEEAARFVPIERLAVSPQCGFASVDQGNLLSWDDQRRKLELVTEVAQRVWG